MIHFYLEILKINLRPETGCGNAPGVSFGTYNLPGVFVF